MIKQRDNMLKILSLIGNYMLSLCHLHAWAGMPRIACVVMSSAPITIHVPPLCLFHFLFYSPFILFSFSISFLFILGTYFFHSYVIFFYISQFCIFYNPSKQTNKRPSRGSACVSPYTRLNCYHTMIFFILDS